MGVTFRGNPYDQDYDYDSDWEINTDEEWVIPPHEIIGTADRNNILFITADDEDSDIFDITNDDETNPDDDEDYIPEEDNGSYSPDEEDDDYNPDDENYPEYDDIQNFIGTQEDNYVADISDDEDDELDYVTYPIADNHVSSQPSKTNDNNSLTRDNSDNDC